MDRCAKCGRIFTGYSDFCARCQREIERIGQVEYDEQQVADFSVIASRVLHGPRPQWERRWRIG